MLELTPFFSLHLHPKGAMAHYLFARLLPDNQGNMELYVIVTDDFESAHNWPRPLPSIHGSVEELVKAAKKLDTSNVVSMVLDINHSFGFDGADNERDAALNLMNDLFVGLTAMKPSNLLTLKLRLDDRMGLTSTDVHTINQKVAIFRAAQDPPFPSLSIIGQSHMYRVRFFTINISQFTSLSRLSLEFVEVDGYQLLTYLSEATDLEYLKLKDVVITGFNNKNPLSPLFSFYHWLSNDESHFVTTEFCLENSEDLVKHGVHNFGIDSDWVRNKHHIARAHQDLPKETGQIRLLKIVNNLSVCNDVFNVDKNKTRAIYSLLRKHYLGDLV